MSATCQSSNKMTFVKLKRCDIIVLVLILAILPAMFVTCAKLESRKTLTPNHRNDVPITEPKPLLGALQAKVDSSRGEDHKLFNMYRSELKRLSYESIYRILRDENEPSYKEKEEDVLYKQKQKHKIKRRAVEVQKQHFLNLAHGNLTTFIAAQDFKGALNSITDLDLSHNKLQTLNLTGFTQLQLLNVANNSLEVLPRTDNTALSSLNLNHNHVKSAEAQRGSQLRVLHLCANGIQHLTALNLSQLTELETLDLSCNRIENLETSFFPERMHNLKHLNLAHNQLGSIYRETFYNLLSLNTLLLTQNNISDIDYETFLALPNLQYLDLSFNKLRGESIRALQGIPDLVGLSIAYNPQVGASMQEFVASWSLKELDASGTGLCQIPAALAQSVRTLKLTDNWLKVINCGDLDSYPLLQYLDLSASRIEEIEDDALGRLEILEVLFLDHNSLRKIPYSLPTSLEHLFLQNNQIMDIQVQAFQGLNNLQTLDLSGNKLLYLPALPLPKLLTLNLQSSGLKGLNQAIVHTLPRLRDLMLEDNPIKCSDLLGIAEWASPCRLAERSSTFVGSEYDAREAEKLTDMGQQQQAAKIDLKQKFLQMHNFFEKFKCDCEPRPADGKKQDEPPTCASTAKTATKTKLINFNSPASEALKRAKASAIRNVHEAKVGNFNQQNRTTEITKSSEDSAHNKPEILQGTTAVPTADRAREQNANAAEFVTDGVPGQHSTLDGLLDPAVIPSTTSSTMRDEYVHQLTPQPLQAHTATATTAAPTAPTPWPINHRKKGTTEFVVGIQQPENSDTTRTTALAITTPIATKNAAIHVPQTISTTIASDSNYSETSSSLSQKGFKTSAANGGTALPDLIAATAPASTDLAQQDNKRRSTEAVKKSGEQENDAKRAHPRDFDDISGQQNAGGWPTTEGGSTTLAPTTATHKHEPLQLHIRDRHLIGTPLLMHKGENVMVEAEQLMLLSGSTAKAPTPSLVTAAPAATPHPKTNSAIDILAVRQPNATRKANKDSEAAQKSLELGAAIRDKTNEHKNAEVPTTPRVKLLGGKKYEEKKKLLSLTMKKMTVTTKHTTPAVTAHTLNAPRENESTRATKQVKPSHENIKANRQHKHSTVNTPVTGQTPREPATFTQHHFESLITTAEEEQLQAPLKAHDTKSEHWLDVRKDTAASGHPGLVILLSFALFVILLVGLMHVYRCEMPWRRHLPQQRPHQQHLSDDDAHSFLNYQSHQQPKWHHSTRLQPPYHSPLHNLHVRELQKTSAVDEPPKRSNQFYSATCSGVESQTSSSRSSSHSSAMLDDEAFYIEMTPDSGQPTGTLHSDLLPMELLSVSASRHTTMDTTMDALNDPLIANACATSSVGSTNTAELSLLNGAEAAAINGIGVCKPVSKLTPSTRKFGLW